MHLNVQSHNNKYGVSTCEIPASILLGGRNTHILDNSVLQGPARQPGQLLAMIPLPVEHALEPPAKVTQLAMLEQRAAIRLMRTAHKVGRPVHFDRDLLPIVESNERVDAVPGDLASMLVLYAGTT